MDICYIVGRLCSFKIVFYYMAGSASGQDEANPVF